MDEQRFEYIWTFTATFGMYFMILVNSPVKSNDVKSETEVGKSVTIEYGASLDVCSSYMLILN